MSFKELVEEAKQSMSKDAVAIRMRKQNLVDQQHRLREEARIQCENAFMDVNRRMKETSDAYCLALESQLKSLEESTITEDTLLDEMVHASQFQRDRIRTATAIPPLLVVMDADRLQLQVKCASAEEKADELQVTLDLRNEAYYQVKREKLALQLELDSAKNTLGQINAHNSTLTRQNK